MPKRNTLLFRKHRGMGYSLAWYCMLNSASVLKGLCSKGLCSKGLCSKGLVSSAIVTPGMAIVGSLVLMLLSPISIAQQQKEPTEQNPAQTELKSEVKKELKAIAVTTVALKDVWIEPLQKITAEVLALKHAQVSAQANGQVLSIDVEVGDTVEQGATLVALDCRQSKLSEAVLNDVLSLARKEYQRAQKLQKSQTIAEQELTRIQSTLEQARIRIQQSELAVEHCLVVAPFSGVVTERQVQLGMLATPGAPMVRLLQREAIELKAALSKDQLTSLQMSRDIRFISDNQSYPVEIRTVLPLLDPISNQHHIRLRFTQGLPFAGASGEMVWPEFGKYLPGDLLVERAGQLGYFLLEGNIAHFQALPDATPGHPAGIDLDVQASENTQIVIEGRYQLNDGDRVSPAVQER